MHIKDKRPHPSKVKDLLADSCNRVALNECCSIIKSLPYVSLNLFLYHVVIDFYVFRAL